MADQPRCFGCGAPAIWTVHVRWRTPRDWRSCEVIGLCEKHAATIGQDSRLSVVGNFEPVMRAA